MHLSGTTHAMERTHVMLFGAVALVTIRVTDITAVPTTIVSHGISINFSHYLQRECSYCFFPTFTISFFSDGVGDGSW